MLMAALAAGTMPAGLVRAQAAFPTRPVRVTVPFGAGGAANPHANRIARECAEAGFTFHR